MKKDNEKINRKKVEKVIKIDRKRKDNIENYIIRKKKQNKEKKLKEKRKKR